MTFDATSGHQSRNLGGCSACDSTYLTDFSIVLMWDGALDILSAVFGWIYFVCWSISFYPQIWLNYKRGTTAGLSSDFILLNLWGFICFAIYNCMLYWNENVRVEYERRYGKDNLVELNDVVYTLHAVLLGCICLYQGLRKGAWRYWLPRMRNHHYVSIPDEEDMFNSRRNSEEEYFTFFSVKGDRPERLVNPSPKSPKPVDDGILAEESVHRMSWPALAFFVISVTGAIVLGLLCVFDCFMYLDWLYYLFLVKVLATLFKCCPQLYFNFILKSTVGWSVANVLLDIFGGFFSIIQLVIDAWRHDHWEGILGNPLKPAIGLISIVVDSIFLVQHYILYEGNDPFAVDPEEVEEL